MSDEIIFEQINQWGVITLNRPKALNALTHSMVLAMKEQMIAWQEDASIVAVMIKGAGDRAFCAGGDIRWLHDRAKENVDAACAFFRDEYSNNTIIKRFSKPYVALINGIVMGGGVGVSVHGNIRIAGDKTLFAMPETGIGLFPDVGGGYFLPRLEKGLGYYYGLTGARAKAGDCLEAGIATHYVPDETYHGMSDELLALDLSATDAEEKILNHIEQYSQKPSDIPIEKTIAEIERFFLKPESLLDLLTQLQNDNSDFAQQTLSTLQKMSPTSLFLTFEQLQNGRKLEFEDVMKMEFRIVSRIMESHDFFEGVRALIIDKDRSPQWSPEHVGQIQPSMLTKFFETLGDKELYL